MKETLTWLALLARPNVGCVTVRREVELAGDPAVCWNSWRKANPSEAAEAWELAKRQWDRAQEIGAHIVTFHDVRYPSLLAQIPDAPPVLFAKGTWPSSPFWSRALAVVGTRSCTPQAASWALQAGRQWTEAGGQLISGLARGIDGRAHRGALNGRFGGRQVAVLPCSLEGVYPRIHQALADEILDAGGLLLTEQPPGSQVERWKFASRNRILTGLAPTTLVVQSPARGGSLISARCAMDQNRDVFVVWQRGMDKSWAGNRALVADEIAHPVRDIDDLWQTMGKQAADAGAALCTTNPAGLPEGCKAVWSMLTSHEAVTWRQLRDTLCLNAHDLNRQLFTLEFQGWIRRLPGRAYLRC